MKINFLILLSILSIVILSCDDGVKFDNPNDQNADIADSNDSQNDEDKDSTDTVADEDSNEQADTENDENSDPNDTTPDDADPADDNSDSADDEDTIDPDVTDTGETVGETRVADCSGLPENAIWNTVSAIVQTWNGEKWVPSAVASFNLEGSEDECRFKCYPNYTWNGSVCAADTKNAYCDAKPENSEWNDGNRNGTFTQTWDGESWTPANHAAVYSKNAEECAFVCVAGYIWNNSFCETAPTQSANCTGLPANAQWNTVSTITQTWDGESWYPTTAGIYDENPSTSRCRYKCKENYSWKNNKCVADTRTTRCTGLISGAAWNTASEITQTWSGSEWLPTAAGVYNENPSTTECRYACTINYTWNGSICAADTNVGNCAEKPANSTWNDGGRNGTYPQTWNGSTWMPATYPSTYSKTAGTCTFICATGYIWNNNACETAPTQSADCTGLPTNAQWNTASSITQTWDGSTWSPSTAGVYNTTASTTECRYTCKQNYNWQNSQCKAATQNGNCAQKPANTVWNDGGRNGTFEQTWNGTDWNPETYQSVYSTTAGVCRYKCADSYHWENQTCVYNTKTSSCTGLIDNAQWNTAASITQNWNGSLWTPSTAGTYNTTASTSECRYTCKPNYNWQNSQCVAATRNGNCSEKPANTAWNDNGANGTFTQTWNGENWNPETYQSVYSTTAGICHYKCDNDSHFENSQCTSNTKTADCQSKPEHAVWNDGGLNGKFTQNWNGSAWNPASHNSSYNKTAGECTFVCAAGYIWDGVICDVAPTQTANCTGLPAAGAEWNTATSITQTWDGEQWTPSETGTYNETASTTECRFKCLVHYNWNGSTCVADTKNSPCMGLPENAQWNTATSITQTWNGSSWTPSTTGSYNTTASTTECRFKCNSGYTYENGNCINQKTASCTGLPTNATWNTATSITQTWNGSSWTPSATGTYNTTSSTSECRFKCKTNYNWNSSNKTCDAAKQTVNCTAKPANTVWNTVSTITQTWTGSAWSPSNTSTYNETASTTQCRYKCDSTHYWYNSECTSPCDSEPCEEVANSTHVCTATSWQDYSCGCNNDYIWNNTSCVSGYVNLVFPHSVGGFKGEIVYFYGQIYIEGLTDQTVNQSVPLDGVKVQFGIKSQDSADYQWYDATVNSGFLNSNWGDLDEYIYAYKFNEIGNFEYTFRFSADNGKSWKNADNYGSATISALTLGNICTGQTSCYNASSSMTCPSSSSANFFGQDAQYRSKCTAQSFTSSSDVVIDNNTGLTWEKSPSSGTYTWANANNHCADLNSSNYAGIDTWRVPNPLEFMTIVDNSKYNPATNSNFTGMPTDSSVWFWTSKEYKSDTEHAYVFKPYYGDYDSAFSASAYLKTKTYKVLCVSGNEMQPATSSNFTTETISGSVVVTDSKTGLMWQKEYVSNKTWQQALKYCEDSTYAGYSDWRLPNKNELAFLINYEISDSPYSYFPDTGYFWYWSSSTGIYNTGRAWVAEFNNGYMSSRDKTEEYRVRCVR